MRLLRVIYDGDCPFCSRYVQLVRLRENFTVELTNAREEPGIARSYGLDLNEGMIVDIEGDVYHGADAVWLLSRLSSKQGLMNLILATTFARRATARILYPVLRLSRNLTLMLMGRRQIR